MQIREYQQSDYGQIEKIYNVSRPDEFYAEPEQFSLVLWSEDDYIQSIVDKSKIVVCEEDTVLGFCGYLDKHINWLFVAPEFRRKGVASQLLRFVLPRVGKGATLSVGQSNERACNLYLNFGFVVKRKFVVNFQSKELAVSNLVWEGEGQ